MKKYNDNLICLSIQKQNIKVEDRFTINLEYFIFFQNSLLRSKATSSRKIPISKKYPSKQS